MGGPRSDGGDESRCGAIGRGLTRGKRHGTAVFGVRWITRVGQRVESLADGIKPPLDERWCGLKPVELENSTAKGGPPDEGYSAPLIYGADRRLGGLGAEEHVD